MTTIEFKTYITQTLTPQGWELMTEFFISFARFECALKNCQFISLEGDRVKPNWDTFINSIRQPLSRPSPLGYENATNFILTNPPRIQILNNGTLDWRERVFPQNTDDITKLKQHICDIRNNFFHGGKFQGIYHPDISRNYRLIEYALITLNYWLTLNINVNQSFSEQIV
jgi:hypothetical protein